MKVNKKTLSLVILFCLILVIGIQLIAAAIEVPLSPYCSNSNTDWWQYQFEGYENDPDHAFNKNVNCGPACSAMLINYLRDKGVTTTYHASISSAHPEVHCYARWDYCKDNGLSNGYDDSDWDSPGGTTEQIRSALSSENIQTHIFTGYDCLDDGSGITNLQNAIDQGKVCICLVAPMYYREEISELFNHWVIAYGYDNNYIYLNDPGYHTGQGFQASISDFALALWHVTGLSTVIVSDTTIYNYPTVDSFNVTPTSITLGDAFNISYTVSDDIGLQQTELWRVNDIGGEPGDWNTLDNPIFTKVLSGEKNYSGSFTDTPDTVGTYWYGMHVVDTSGNWSVEPKPPGPIMVIVTNPPVADAGVNQTVNSGQVVWFDGCNSSDSDGTIISYGWDFGDGATATGCAVSHRFRGAMNESKTYAVTLTVEDNSGTTATDSCDITVMPLEKPVKVTHQPSVPIPGVTVFAKMEVSYNWVDEISGEDVYIVSRVDCSSNGFAGIYAFNFIDKHSRANPWTTPTIHPLLWWNLLLCRGPSEKTYGKDDFKDFEFFKEKAYGKDFFEGIEVYAYDIMYITAYGYAGMQMGYLTPFLERNSTYFRPESTEVPTVPIDINDLNLVHLCSPGEMRVYDPEGRVTGLVNGEIKEEIPYSAYNDNIVIILSPVDSYRYKVVGTEEGLYGLGVASVEDGEVTTFTATDIPTTSTAVHQYIIDWDALSQGEEGVTVQVDSDGDGKFEDTFTSDDELTQDDFLEETSPPLIGDFGSANSGPPDCIVDFEDLMIFALAYGATPSDPNWNAVCDIAGPNGPTPDGVIDFEDLMVFAMHYGETCADL